MLGINEEFDEFRENTEKKLDDLNTSATSAAEEIDNVKDKFIKVTYDPSAYPPKS